MSLDDRFSPQPGPDSADVPPATFSTADAARRIGASSERWLIEQIRAGRFPARKIGRHWRMTAEDISAALDACKNSPGSQPAPDRPAGLTPTSRRRVLGHGGAGVVR